MNREELLKNAKPILFNTEMVQAILEGRKTVTRRIMKPQPPEGYICAGKLIDSTSKDDNKNINKIAFTDLDYKDSHFYKMLYQVVDILYVRETFRYVMIGEETYECECLWNDDVIEYKASEEDFIKEYGMYVGEYDNWHPSIHMPKEVARIFLKVTDVRVERLQNITEEQAKAEGTKLLSNDGITIYTKDYKTAFSVLWNSTIKKQDLDKYGWEANPWVWVIEFERVVAE